MALGIAIAFVASTAATFDADRPLGHEVYFDSLTMFVFFLLSGRLLELRLRDRTAGALEALMRRVPRRVERQQGDERHYERVAVRRLRAGDVMRVLPGEAFPADGAIIAGAKPGRRGAAHRRVASAGAGRGRAVIAGSSNLSGVGAGAGGADRRPRRAAPASSP